jgi:predicted nucleotidyltransferase
MARHIQDPTTIFPDITDDYKAIFGDDLVSIILYGSATGPDFRPGSSDINFMVVLTEDGIGRIDQSFEAVKKWRKRRVAVPLFLTEEYVNSSLDAFPIEYLSFQRNHVQVFGKEILNGLAFKPEFIRLQCEREIKGKLLLLREAFIERGGKGRALKVVIQEALPALIAIFEGILYLKDIVPPTNRREIVRAAAKAFEIDVNVFEGLLDIKEGGSGRRDEEVVLLFKGCLKEMQRLSKTIDSFG